MGGPNLEVFKFGMYIFFPIGWMYYFGTNLDQRFAVPDFWPKQSETHHIPFEKDEIEQELNRLRERRLALRQRRLEWESQQAGEQDSERTTEILQSGSSPILQSLESASKDKDSSVSLSDAQREGSVSGKGWFGWLKR